MKIDNEKLSLKEIQQASLMILVKIDELCKKLNIKYFLAYGTLLGAIRHNGFIPWDDDIDIMMFRDDYLKLISYFDEHELELFPITYRNRMNCLDCWFGLTRFTDLSYQYVENNKKAKSIDMGTFVDVYILDNYGESSSDTKVIYENILKLNYLWIAYTYPKGTSLKKTLIKFPLHFILKILFPNKRKFMLKIENAINKVLLTKTADTDPFIGPAIWDDNKGYAFNRELFKKVITHEFEGYMFMIPDDFDEILVHDYGNYQELPCENERKPHHNYEIYKRKNR